MKPYIPFVYSKTDYELYNSFYKDSEYVRLSLESRNTFYKNITSKLWIDAAVDGFFHALENRAWSEWGEYVSKYKNHKLLMSQEFIKKPVSEKVEGFVFSVLDKCLEYNPSLISIPQLPVVNDSSFNAINRALAKASGLWKEKSSYKGDFVLPIIFSHQQQLKGKSQWSKKISLAKKCFELSKAKLVWSVDSSLSDQDGSDKLTQRFLKLVEFHKDLKNSMPSCSIINGPYWGMNLIIWAKNLSEYPGISLGSGYQYRISGGFRGARAKKRIALPPLRRWAVANNELKIWIEKAIEQLSPDEDSYKELNKIKDKFSIYTPEVAKRQIAEFYKKWFEIIYSAPSPSRYLALYQDLSLAYVLGKRLMEFPDSVDATDNSVTNLPGELPKTEGPGRNPSKVAQQFMLQCL